MKKLLCSIAAVCVLAAATIANAQPAPKILVVDMSKLFEGHYKFAEQKVKMDKYGQTAQANVDQMQKDLNTMGEDFKKLDEQFKNPALNADAKSSIQTQAQTKLQEIQAKRTELQQFYSDTQRSMQAQFQNFHDGLMDDIGRVVTEVAKRHGATLVLDKSGRVLGSGYLAIPFSDPSYDITDEVAAEIAKNKPAGPTPVSTPAAAPAAAPSTSSAPESGGITIPNVNTGK